MADDLRPFRVEVPEEVLVDLRDRLRAPGGRTRSPARRWDYGTDLAYLQDLCDDVAARLRLARAGGAVQPLAALPHRHRRHSRCTSSTRVHRSPTPSRSSSRTAGRARFPSSSTSSTRCRPARTAVIQQRVPRRLSVDPRLRVVGPDDREPGWDVMRVAERVEDADGAARLRPLRRAGWRLGRDDLGDASPRSTGSTSPDCTATCCSRSRPTRAEIDALRRGDGRPRVGGRVHADAAARTRRSRARTRRRSGTASPIPRPGSRVGSSRSSTRGPITTATSRPR